MIFLTVRLIDPARSFSHRKEFSQLRLFSLFNLVQFSPSISSVQSII